MYERPDDIQLEKLTNFHRSSPAKVQIAILGTLMRIEDLLLDAKGSEVDATETLVDEDEPAPAPAPPKPAAKPKPAEPPAAKADSTPATPKDPAPTTGAEGDGPADKPTLTVRALKAALRSGDHDAELAELLEAELNGDNRPGAVKALNARIAKLAALAPSGDGKNTEA